MEKKKISVSDLKKDIINAEKYFNRSGDTAKEAYELLNEEINEADSVSETIYLYIPGTVRDTYDVFLN